MKRSLLALALVGLLIPGVAEAKKRNRDRGGDKDKPHHERALTMEKGTWQLGGSATIDFTNWSGETDVSFNLNPSGGYFVADKFEILGIVDIDYASDLTWGVGPGVRYHFDLKPSWIYAGAGLLYYGIEGYPINGRLEGGLLYPLARNVALNAGLKADLYFPDGGDMYYAGHLGYLGVDAYWK